LSKQQVRKLRVIGGEWRRRLIEFPDVDAIRPTPDRVRETLFSWLQSDIHEANCAEPFAGSGILSIEALSRGAKHCVILDQAKAAIHAIKSNLETLSVSDNQYQCVQADARAWLSSVADKSSFDIVFLDPPFADSDLVSLITSSAKLLRQDGKIYVETSDALDGSVLPQELKLKKQKRAGAVHYALLELQ
jgi:16S rRNA (guanine966-N2)-methyltransferase